MKLRDLTHPAFLLLIGCTATLAGILSYHVLVTVPARQHYFEDSRFRALGVLGHQLQGSMASILEALETAGKRNDNYRAVAEFVVDHAELFEFVERESCVGSGHGKTLALRSDPYSNQAFSSAPRLPPDEQGPSATQFIEASLYARYECEPAPTETPTDTGTLQATETPTEAPIATPTLPIPAAATPVPICQQKEFSPLCAKTTLGRLIAKFTTGTALERHDLFIASAKGRVLYSRGSRRVAIAEFPRRPAPAPESILARLGVDVTSTHRDERSLDALPFIDDLWRAAASTRYVVGGTEYQLLTYPVELPAPIEYRILRNSRRTAEIASTDADATHANAAPRGNRPPPNRWIIGVVVPRDYIQAESSAVSLGAWAYVPLFFLQVLVAVPLLKLRFLSSRSPFSRSDGILVVLSFTATTTLLAVFATAWHAYYTYDHHLDEELRAWSMHLRSSLTKDLKSVQSALVAYRKLLVLKGVEGQETNNISDLVGIASPERFEAPRHVLTQHDCCDLCREAVQQCTNEASAILHDLGGRVLPPEMFWFASSVNAEGKGPRQTHKATIWNRNTPSLEMSRLPGYALPVDGHVTRSPSSRASCCSGLSLVVRRAPTLADTITTISSPFSDSEPRDRSGVIATVVRLPSLEPFSDPPVAFPGFGFAVTQHDGLAVFHSSRERRLHENLLDEIDRPYKLESAFAASRERFLDANYRGRAHRVHVAPIEGLPWFLVTWRDKELLRTFDLDILATWLIAWLAFVIIQIVLLGLSYIVLKIPTSVRGFWPHTDISQLYRDCLIALLLLGITISVPVFGEMSGSESLLAAIFVAPWTAVSYVGLQLRIAASGHTCIRKAGSVESLSRRSNLCLRSIIISGPMLLGALLTIQGRRAPDILFVALGAICTCFMSSSLVRATAGSHEGSCGTRPSRLSSFSGAPVRWMLPAIGTLLVIVVGILPGIGLYKDAFNLAAQGLQRFAMHHIAERAAARELMIRSRYEDVLYEGKLGQRLDTRHDHPPPTHWTLFRDGGAEFEKRGSEPWLSLLDRGLHVLTAHPCFQDSQRAVRSPEPILTERCRLARKYFAALLMGALPVYHPESAQLREFLHEEASHKQWTSGRTMTGATHLSVPSDVWLAYTPVSAKLSTYRVIAKQPLPLWLFPLDVLQWLVAGALLAASVCIVFALSSWILRRTYDGASWEIGLADSRGPSERQLDASVGLVLVYPGPEVVRGLHARTEGWTSIDARESAGVRALRDRKEELVRGRFVVINHFDACFDSVAYRRNMLGHLEGLVLRSDARVVLVSRIDPFRKVSQLLGLMDGASIPRNEQDANELRRWVRLLARLLILDGELLPSEIPNPQKWVASILEEDSRNEGSRDPDEHEPTSPPLNELIGNGWFGTPRMKSVAREFRRAIGDVPKRSPALEAGLIAAVEPLYREIWATLTDDERLVLIHLAEQHMVTPTPTNWRIIGDLERRGLVARCARRPMPRFTSSAFRDFAERIEPPSEVYALEYAFGRSTWEKLRTVLTGVAIVSALALFVTRPDVLTYWTGAAAGLGGAVAAIVQILGLLRSRAASSSGG